MKERNAKPTISVIVPTYNRKVYLEKLLISLSQQKYPKESYEIIVIDDGSIGGTEEVVKKFYSLFPIRYHKQANRGISSARNEGIRKANGEVVAFVDDDCVVKDNWLKEISITLSNSKYVTVYGSTNPEGPNSIFTNSVALDSLPPGGGNFALKKEILNHIGLFDLNFYNACEDLDLFKRLEKGGYKSFYNSKMVINHSCKYQHFNKYLKDLRVNQYYVLLWTKHREYIKKEFLERSKSIIQCALRKSIYLGIICFLPLPHTNFWIRFLLGLCLFWVRDFFRLIRIKSSLKNYRIRVHFGDQVAFVVFNWLVDFVALFYLIKGFVKYSFR